MIGMKLGTVTINREKRILKVCNNQFPCCAKHQSFGGWISEIMDGGPGSKEDAGRVEVSIFMQQQL